MDANAATEHRPLQASLRRRNGPLSETAYRLRGDVFRAGRDPENDLIIEGPEAAIVSSRHLEIRRIENTFRVIDLGSTNGTYLDGQRITEAALQNHALITMGPGGPEFQFELEAPSETDLNQTVRLPVK